MKLLNKIIAAAAAFSLCTAVPVYSNAVPFLENVSSLSAGDTVQSGSVSSFSSLSEAGVFVRSQLKARTTSVTVIVPKNGNSLSANVNAIMETALAETDSPEEGDYLRMAVGSYECSSMVSDSRLQLTLNFRYHSTAEQEKEVTKTVASILDSLGIKGKSDYEKIYAIYDHIAKNVSYADDLGDTTVFSAYGALKNKQAVCQGFSQLLYRMLREAGINSRVIEGTTDGVNHAWNIAELDGKYYLMDITWDSAFEGKRHPFFLKGADDFDSYDPSHAHVTGTGNSENYAIFPDYTASAFTSKYSVAKASYDPNAFKLGDVDGDGVIAASDAAIVLNAYAEASATGNVSLTSLQRKAADVTGNGKIDALDASLILKYYAAANKTGSASFDDLMA